MFRATPRYTLFPYTTLFRSIDAGHERLRVAVDEREPRRLYLDHEPVPLEKHMVAVAQRNLPFDRRVGCEGPIEWKIPRSEEHTSELQSPDHLVCRLLLEKKK